MEAGSHKTSRVKPSFTIYVGEIGARMNKISSAAWRRKAGTLGDAHTRSEGDAILVGSGSNPDTSSNYPDLNRMVQVT